MSHRFDEKTYELTVTKTFQLRPVHVRLLREFQENSGFMEYRDAYSNRMGRIISDLHRAGLIVSEEMAWHETYTLTPLGWEIVGQLDEST